MHRCCLLMMLTLAACKPGDDSGEEPAGDDTATDTDTPAATAADVAWALHEDIESLVLVSWQQEGDATAWVEYAFDAGDWLQTPAEDLDAGPQEQLLLGVPYDSELSFRVVLDSDAGQTTSDPVAAATGPGLTGLPQATVAVADAASWDATTNYLYLSLGVLGGMNGFQAWRVIMDRQGRVVWARKNASGSATFYASVSRDGDDLLFDDTRILDKLDSHVYRSKIDGTLVDSYDTPGLHHAFVELSDETIIWGDGRENYETLEVLHPDGTQDTLWSCRNFEESHGLPNGWCQSNTLFWNEDAGTLLYSFYSSMTVVELDVATGETLRSWGQLSDWKFSPPESQFDWQHGVSITDTGTMLLSAHVSTDSIEGVVREYELDEDNTTLEQINSFGVGDGITADSYGEAHRLPGGNTLQNYGTTTRVREFTPDGTVVWDVSWSTGDGDPAGIIGRSVFLDDLYAFAP
jgi:hypothetical protein